MPSWQAKAMCAFIRIIIKRRVQGEEAALVRHSRKKMEPRWMPAPMPKGVTVTQVAEAEVRGEWIRATGANGPARRTIYYLHGGGYVACSPTTHRMFTAALARATEAEVFALDYRLAPEHRHPAAVEDAVAGYRWLLAQGKRPEEITIGGDSAGGGLTIATLLALRDAGVELPCAAFCLSPWTDLAATGPSILANDRRDPMFYGNQIAVTGQIYAGQTPLTNPLVSPIYGDLRGLPPLRIDVSDTEVLLDDSTRLAERARNRGVDVDLHVWSGLPHVWPIFVGFGLPEAKEAITGIAGFIQRHQPAAQSHRSAA
ncbi:MAG: alpha/beta hydrolase [Blastocatellia bacterium]|nr:alpha/beta hydrolase [Blastocatellia bacterium]